MSVVDFYYHHRRKLKGLALALSAPALLLVGLIGVSTPDTSVETLRTAAIALDNYYTDNPPNGVWQYKGVRIVDSRLIIDVHVGIVPHATVIESRNKRIRYSYMKLACPTGDPIVDKWTEESRVWINLNFHGKTLIEGKCPKGKQGGLYTS